MENAQEFGVQLCDTCDGSGKHIYDYHGNPQKIANNYGSDEYPVYVDQAYDPTSCYVCDGLAYVKKNGCAYKSVAMRDRMIKSGSAKKCYHCDDNAMSWKIPSVQNCQNCSGTGFTIVYDSESLRIPDVIDIYDYIHESFRDGWVNDVEIIVDRAGGSLTWGEAYLGLGCIWSSSDYGKHWEMADEEVIASVRASMAESSFQLISLCDKQTRMLSRTVIIKLTHNGYSLIAAGKRNISASLPPAYYGIVDLPVDTANRIIGN